MSYVIAIANQKGGVAKTTSTITLAHALAYRGKRVLALDPDFSVVAFRPDFMRVSARYLMKAHRNQWFWKLSYAPKVPYRVLPGVQITWCKGQKPSY